MKILLPLSGWSKLTQLSLRHARTPVLSCGYAAASAASRALLAAFVAYVWGAALLSVHCDCVALVAARVTGREILLLLLQPHQSSGYLLRLVLSGSPNVLLPVAAQSETGHSGEHQRVAPGRTTATQPTEQSRETHQNRPSRTIHVKPYTLG